MDLMYQRTALLIGEEGVEKLKSSKVLVVGLGGVGGFVCEALARAGVGTLGLCDSDAVEESNLNRQILALRSSLGMMKTKAASKRIGDINPSCGLKVFPFRIGSDEQLEEGRVLPVSALNIESWDYIADAIDDVRAKISLICAARAAGVPVISSMGTGNKLYPDRFQIKDISKTHTDPLAKSVRVKLRQQGIDKGVKVLFSDEEPIVKGAKPVPSISFVPSCAGLMIAGEIIRDLIG
ncbi:MAG: ThiF family adenylyltransferase [Firmicutes bacterium]|nr:ThiF family adenylyltransferase [Bacillota bacterium]